MLGTRRSHPGEGICFARFLGDMLIVSLELWGCAQGVRRVRLCLIIARDTAILPQPAMKLTEDGNDFALIHPTIPFSLLIAYIITFPPC